MRGPLGWVIWRWSSLKSRRDRLRYIWLSQAFEKAGRGGVIGRRVQFMGNMTIELGDRVGIRDGCKFAGYGLIRIGRGTAINDDCIITAMESVEIGSDVMLAPRVYILDVDHKFSDPDIPISRQGYEVAPVFIEDGVWVGAGTVITRGVRVGRGAVIVQNDWSRKSLCLVYRRFSDWFYHAGDQGQSDGHATWLRGRWIT